MESTPLGGKSAQRSVRGNRILESSIISRLRHPSDRGAFLPSFEAGQKKVGTAVPKFLPIKKVTRFCRGVFLVLFMEKVPKPPLRVGTSDVPTAAEADLQVVLRYTIPLHKCYFFFSANKYCFLSLV